MKAASHTRIVSRILFALTLSGVLHAALPTEKTKKKLRMAVTDPASETMKTETELLSGS
ncbi:hypothetical protein OJ996_20655 [Luteolibacter sp. GHJ8]|uniref:Uncharacterized protein n=1 Tax=Luteolibacter rhizosphaerae TaxID=2989719 RepID=A0ABT3G838_9BACT|nr:hypothetical protein [Luteolibacter rhizosphaerae]MCW1916011.1 hypothetical protein [Luteolibacter rhizosphaerae]